MAPKLPYDKQTQPEPPAQDQAGSVSPDAGSPAQVPPAAPGDPAQAAQMTAAGQQGMQQPGFQPGAAPTDQIDPNTGQPVESFGQQDQEELEGELQKTIGYGLTLKRCFRSLSKLSDLVTKYEMSRGIDMSNYHIKLEEALSIIKAIAKNPSYYKSQLGEITSTIKLVTIRLMKDFLIFVKKHGGNKNDERQSTSYY